jgi:hypothetical protein
MDLQSQRDETPQRSNQTAATVIRKADTNSAFAIGYMYWTATTHGTIIETSFTGYRLTRYRRKPLESRQWQK